LEKETGLSDYPIEVTDRSWTHARNTIFELSDRRTDISFGSCAFGVLCIPTLEVRFDDPDLACTDFSIVRCEQKRKKASSALEQNLLTVYQIMLQILRDISFPLEFAWITAPVIFPSEDETTNYDHLRKAMNSGGIVMIWAKGDDEQMKDALRHLSGAGQIRIQNMKTGNTWIKGHLDSHKLEEDLLK